MASLVVQKNLGITDGKQFDMAYVTLMGKWRTRLSLTIHREVTNCCFRDSFSRGYRKGLRGVESTLAVIGTGGPVYSCARELLSRRALAERAESRREERPPPVEYATSPPCSGWSPAADLIRTTQKKRQRPRNDDNRVRCSAHCSKRIIRREGAACCVRERAGWLVCDTDQLTVARWYSGRSGSIISGCASRACTRLRGGRRRE
eukprot:1176551-Prorocentrum_minimum.AAC.2